MGLGSKFHLKVWGSGVSKTQPQVNKEISLPTAPFQIHVITHQDILSWESITMSLWSFKVSLYIQRQASLAWGQIIVICMVIFVLFHFSLNR